MFSFHRGAKYQKEREKLGGREKGEREREKEKKKEEEERGKRKDKEKKKGIAPGWLKAVLN